MTRNTSSRVLLKLLLNSAHMSHEATPKCELYSPIDKFITRVLTPHFWPLKYVSVKPDHVDGLSASSGNLLRIAHVVKNQVRNGRSSSAPKFHRSLVRYRVPLSTLCRVFIFRRTVLSLHYNVSTPGIARYSNPKPN